MSEGRVVGIYTAPAEGEPMQSRDQVFAIAGKGLEGDRYAIAAGTYSGVRRSDAERAVTLIERESVQDAVAEHSVELAESETRRNIVTEGIELNPLVGKDFTVGGVRMRGIDLADPCEWLEDLTRPGVMKSLVNRGGLRAEILDDGDIKLGDPIFISSK